MYELNYGDQMETYIIKKYRTDARNPKAIKKSAKKMIDEITSKILNGVSENMDDGFILRSEVLNKKLSKNILRPLSLLYANSITVDKESNNMFNLIVKEVINANKNVSLIDSLADLSIDLINLLEDKNETDLYIQYKKNICTESILGLNIKSDRPVTALIIFEELLSKCIECKKESEMISLIIQGTVSLVENYMYNVKNSKVYNSKEIFNNNDLVELKNVIKDIFILEQCVKYYIWFLNNFSSKTIKYACGIDRDSRVYDVMKDIIGQESLEYLKENLVLFFNDRTKMEEPNNLKSCLETYLSELEEVKKDTSIEINECIDLIFSTNLEALMSRNNEINNLNKYVDKLGEKLDENRREKARLNKEIKEYKLGNKAKAKKIEELNKVIHREYVDIEPLKNEIDDKNKKIDVLEETKMSLNNELNNKDRKIKQLNDDIKTSNQMIEKQRDYIRELEKLLKASEENLAEDKEISDFIKNKRIMFVGDMWNEDELKEISYNWDVYRENIKLNSSLKTEIVIFHCTRISHSTYYALKSWAISNKIDILHTNVRSMENLKSILYKYENSFTKSLMA